MYGVTGVPHAVFGGISAVSGGSASGTMYNAYLQRYNQIINTSSPMALEVELSFNAQSQLVVSSQVVITGNFSSTNNRIYFAITLDGPGNPRFLVVDSAYQDFTQNITGSMETYSQAFDVDPDWNFEHLRAVSFVQTMSTPRTIHQANMASLSGVLPNFMSDISQGPPSLVVNFKDLSFSTYDILSWEWDFNNDGIIDSTEPTGTWVYDSIGNYSVSLKIRTELGEETIVRENFIKVISPDDVSGTVGGQWKKEYSPYLVTGNIDIPLGSELFIEDGVEVRFGTDLVLTVSGSLRAQGEKGNEVLFTSDSSWQGISILHNAGDIIFVNAIFEKATNVAIRSSYVDIYVEGCIFRENLATTSSAAINLSSAKNSVIKGSFFANNRSQNSSGVINMTSANLTIENTVIVNNTGRNASAISAVSGSNLTIVNSTIYNNESTNEPSATVTISSSAANLMNTIIDGETPFINLNGTINATYSRIKGHEGIGNITDDPLFVNESSEIGYIVKTSYHDWILSDNSACIDSGNPEIEFNDIADPENLHLALFPAKGSLRNDMGAFGGGGGKSWVPDVEKTIITPISLIDIKAYPNPFNPTLTLNISTKDTVHSLNVSVFNIRGQKIYELINEIPKSTNTILTWNGQNFDGKDMGSGIYFIRANIGNDVSVKRVMLLK